VPVAGAKAEKDGPGRFENGDTVRFRVSDVTGRRAKPEPADEAPAADETGESPERGSGHEFPRHGSPNGTLPDRARRP
jgi:hypothetical protein